MEETTRYEIYYTTEANQDVLYARSKDYAFAKQYCLDIESDHEYKKLWIVEVKEKTIFFAVKGDPI